ncbi:MAG: carbamoyltransferase HypF [Dissulfurimicrobium sp.]|uniref:carbamoyltransferase HypF n=1 Tax=Dissulfurimicrobium sp. TaxID=2022436 RepID=UPI003D124DD9
MEERKDGLKTPDREAVEFLVRGQVQGVGFRPFVYRLAKRFGILGSVANNGYGVVIRAMATKDALSAFIQAVIEKAPSLAKIASIESRPFKAGLEYKNFVILESEKIRDVFVHIPPDVATCPMCLHELSDPEDRRYRYPFINCTDCGPRYSIIESVPYDRERTSMKAFQMCDDCQNEYHSPGDRRFHAEPNACRRCGPGLGWHGKDGEKIETDDPIREAAAALRQGKIVAIKGLGGFHLAADASNEEAVAELRVRKRRPSKPLAVMAADLETARLICEIDAIEAAALTSPRRPIVLLKRRMDAGLALNLAPGIREVGVMLPYTPLHHLIFTFPDAPRVIVLTSGNPGGEPIAKDNNEALIRLSGIADFFLIHDREIVNRLDDSVVRQIGGKIRVIRRSRGYAPEPVTLSIEYPRMIAMGGFLKSTFCLSKGRGAVLSQHIGDLETPESIDFFEEAVGHLKDLFEIEPEAVACDLHPDYPGTRYAMSLGLPVYPVQHHYAHTTAVMAEYGLEGPCISVILDGAGLGPDLTIWGGEVLLADLYSFRRLGRLGHLLLPGGDAAAREPWRMAMSAIFSAFGPDGLENAILPGLSIISKEKRMVLTSMMMNGVNIPLTSSCGRLFDAIAAILGVCLTADYEGQAAMQLETVSWEAKDEKVSRSYPMEISKKDGMLVLDLSTIVKSVLKDLKDAVPLPLIGISFHRWLVEALCLIVKKLSEETGVKEIVLSGGCMQNKILLEGLMTAMIRKGLDPYAGELIPANDGGLSLGQLVVGGTRYVSGRTNGGC